MFYNLMAVYSAPLRDYVEFNPCAGKRALTWRASGMNDNLKGGLLFENEIRNAYGWALRIEKPSRIEV